MSTKELVIKWSRAQMEGDWDAYNALTDDSFQLIGPAPEPLTKEQFLVWCKHLLAAAPDLSNNFEVSEDNESTVSGWLQMQGTNTGDWDLSFMELGVIKATGKPFKNPREAFTVTCKDGKVVSCEVDVPENSGITGIFAQLGIS